MSVPQLDAQREAFVEASRFRSDFYASLTARRDELFELMDALLCADGPVTAPVDLTLLPEHRRGHGALYDALNRGRIDVRKLRRTLAALPQPKAARHRLVLAVDVSNWLRPDAECSADRLFCHTFGRGRDQYLMIPGWPYSFVAALESGRTSWCQLLDAVRLGPEDDIAEITAAQVRRVVEGLIGGGEPLPLWLWSSRTGTAGEEVDLRWQAFLRRFDLEHTFRTIKQTLGWTRPKLRTPEAADRWTWLITTAHTQLRLARLLSQDLRRPWEKPAETGRLTPTRVRRGFRNLRAHLPCPAGAPKPNRPGPGRPLGSKNQRLATRYDVGKTVRRPETITQRDQVRP
ncbi:transposase [Streptomyces lavendulae]|uniref:transposase n=1 Tax=Streptomyces lavendulae TaxID=1914 RepID=UPI00367C5DE3